MWSENQFESRRDPTRADEAQTSASTTNTASRPRQAAQPTKAGSPDFCLCNSHLHLAGVLLACQLLLQPASQRSLYDDAIHRSLSNCYYNDSQLRYSRSLQPYCMILLCCSLLLQYLYYQVLLLISTGTVLVYMYWYCRSIAQIPAYERPTGYIKYESLVRMTLNPTHESIPLDSMCAT